MTENQRMSVPIRSWTLRNFKSAENASVDFAPLTILIGANSSGKSSLLQSMLLISQAAGQAATSGSDLPLNGSLVELGDFEEVLFAGAAQPAPQSLRTVTHLVSAASEDDVQAATAIGRIQRPRRTLELSAVFDFSGMHGGIARSVRWQTLAQREGTLLWSAEFAAASRAAVHGVAQLVRSDLRFVNREGVEVVGFGSKTTRARVSEISRWADVGASITRMRGSLFEAGKRVRIDGISQVAGIPTQFFVEKTLLSFLTEQVVDRFQPPAGGRRRNVDVSAPDLQQIADIIAPRVLAEYVRMADITDSPELNDFVERARVPRRGSMPRPLREHERRDLTDLIVAWATRVLQFKVDSASLSKTTFVPFDRPLQMGLRTDRLGAALVQFLATNILYLGPLREDPHVLYSSSPGDGQGNVGRKGERTVAILHQFGSQKIPYACSDGRLTRGTLIEAVSHWLEYFEIAQNFETELRPRLGLEPHLKIADVERRLDLTSVGVGVSQVLPVLVMGLYSSPDSVLLMEQPELHLHPALQQKLADFLMACTRSGKQLVVETHSDHLVTRLRRRIAESDSEDVLRSVKLIFAERTGGRTTYTPVEISPFGALPVWPRGFFDQSSTESKELLRAAIDKRKRLADERGDS